MLLAVVTIHQRFPYLVVVSQDLPVVKIRLYSRLGSLVWGSLLVVESSGTSMVFSVGSFRLERGHRYIGVYWWAVMAGIW